LCYDEVHAKNSGNGDPGGKGGGVLVARLHEDLEGDATTGTGPALLPASFTRPQNWQNHSKKERHNRKIDMKESVLTRNSKDYNYMAMRSALDR